VAKGVEAAPMKIVGATSRHDVDLRAARVAAFRCVVGRADAKFGHGVERDIETGVSLLGLLLNSAGIDTIKGEVTVIERVSGKADAALGPIAVIDRSRSEQHQAGPVSPADRDLFDLRRLDNSGHFGIGPIDALNHRNDLYRLRYRSHLQLGIHGS